jgi:hypothetical protein
LLADSSSFFILVWSNNITWHFIFLSFLIIRLPRIAVATSKKDLILSNGFSKKFCHNDDNCQISFLVLILLCLLSIKIVDRFKLPWTKRLRSLL